METQHPTSDSFEIEIKVRDYECDIQGIVNNSVYQNYFEHARHEFLLHKGLSFADLSSRGINLVVTRVEIDYKAPLRSGDRFVVSTEAIKAGKIRGQFLQTIHRFDSQRNQRQLMTKAAVHWACINERGRPFAAPEINVLLEN